MDYLLGLLNRAVGDEALARLLFVTAVGLSAVLAVATVTLLVLGLRDPLRRRLGLIKHHQTGSGYGQETPGNLQLLLEQVGQRFTSAEQGRGSATQTLLTHAGYRASAAVQVYWSVRLLLPLLLLGLTLLALPFIPKLSMTGTLWLVATAVAVGWLAPAFYVDKRKQARMTRLLQAFPDALDLLVVCVESGLALPQAIERVADEMAVSQAELALELALVNAQMRAGIPSSEALKQLAERTGLEDIRGLVSLLAQSIRFGTSVGATLRIYAEEFRDRRMQLAEEKAAKIGSKLIFPLVFCLWPSFFLVAIGPALLSVLKVFGKI
jgi:tight adherence protein C